MSTRYWRSFQDHHDIAIEEVVSPQKGAKLPSLVAKSGRRRLLDDEYYTTGIAEVLSPEKTRPEPVDEHDPTTSPSEDIQITSTEEEIVRSSKRLRLVSPTSEMMADDFSIEEVLTQYIEPETPKEVPYHIRNTRTFHKQLEKFLPSIEVDVVICYVWQANSDGPWQALVKDSDNFFSVVETSFCHGELLPVPTAGQRCRLEGLVILQTITPAISTVLFAVFDTIGHYQDAYLRLRVTTDTRWTEMSPEIIEIPYELPEECSPTSFSQELEKLKFSSARNGFAPSFLNVNFSEAAFSFTSSQLNTQFYT